MIFRHEGRPPNLNCVKNHSLVDHIVLDFEVVFGHSTDSLINRDAIQLRESVEPFEVCVDQRQRSIPGSRHLQLVPCQFDRSDLITHEV